MSSRESRLNRRPATIPPAQVPTTPTEKQKIKSLFIFKISFGLNASNINAIPSGIIHLN